MSVFVRVLSCDRVYGLFLREGDVFWCVLVSVGASKTAFVCCVSVGG